MPLTRQQKEKAIQAMQENIASAASVVFVAFDGLTVTDAGELRDKLAESGSGMRVIPKRLLKLALKAAKIDFDPRQHEGQLAVIWGEDAVTPAKTLHEFAKDRESLHLVGGTLEDAVLSAEEVIALASLPSRQQLLGQLASVLAGPARGFVTVLSGVPRGFVQALHAIGEKQAA